MQPVRIESRTGRVELFSSECELVFNEQGGCLSATVPHALSAWGDMLGADIVAFGTWGKCWSGIVVGAGPDTFECAGPDIALSGGFEATTQRIYADNRKNAWKKSSDTDDDPSIGTLDNTIGWVFNKGVAYEANAKAGYIYEFESTQQWANIVMPVSRTNDDYELRVYPGVYDPTNPDEPYDWGTPFLAWNDNTGTTATLNASVSTPMDALKVVAFHATGATPTAAVRIHCSSVTVRTVSAVSSPTVATVCGNLLDTAPAWLSVPWRELSVSTAMSRVLGVVPIDLIREAHAKADAVWRWRSRRAGGLSQVVPTSERRPSAHRYVVDLHWPGAEWQPAASGLLEMFDHAELTYGSANGHEFRVTRTAASLPISRWTKVAADTDNQADAYAVADANLAASSSAYRGTVTTPKVTDVGGSSIPLEHVECGERVKVIGYGRAFTGRIVENRVSSGKATLTIDSAPYSLDYALARVASAAMKTK